MKHSWNISTRRTEFEDAFEMRLFCLRCGEGVVEPMIDDVCISNARPLSESVVPEKKMFVLEGKKHRKGRHKWKLTQIQKKPSDFLTVHLYCTECGIDLSVFTNKNCVDSDKGQEIIPPNPDDSDSSKPIETIVINTPVMRKNP